MKNFLFLSSLLLFGACQSKSAAPAETVAGIDTSTTAEAAPAIDPSASQANLPPPQKAAATPAAPRPYFRGSGNEPGWLLQVQAAEDGTYPVTLLHNYAMDTLQGTFTLIEGKPNEEPFSGDLMLRGKPVNVKALIVKAKCEDDMSGKGASAKVMLKVDGKTFRGCGEHLK